MTSKKYIPLVKTIIRIVMAVAFIAYCLTFFIVTSTHAVIGIVFEVFVISHVLLNGKQFLSYLKDLFANKLKSINKLNCIVDISLILFYASLVTLEILMFVGGDTFLADYKQTFKIIQIVVIVIVFKLILAHGILHIKIAKINKR